MQRRRLRVIDPSGLHARPAARLVKAMHGGGVVGTIAKGDRSANVQSILEILALGIDQGDVVVVELSDEAGLVLETLSDLLEATDDVDD